MHLITGDLWDELGKAALILVSTNAMVNRDGKLVMGRGAAKEAADRFPGLAAAFGAELAERNLVGNVYGLLYNPVPLEGADLILIGAFQVKYHWRDMADLELIGYSTAQLRRLALLHPEKRIAMNFPGISNGRLQRWQVEPIISALPDNVYVYQKGL